MKDRLVRNFVMTITGCIIYFYFEIFVRGYSHISMFILGGVCFNLVGYIGNKMLDISAKLIFRILLIMFISSFLITTLEFLTGLYVNVYLGLSVWDYTHMRMNLFGQICLLYSLIWGLMGLPCVFFYGLLDRFVLKNDLKEDW